MEKEAIKCFICGSPAQLIVKETKLFGGRVVIKDEELYECTKCGDRFLTSEQMKKFEKKLRESHYFVKRKIIRTGRSLAITIPPDFAEFYNLNKGSKVTIVKSGKKEA